MARTVPARVSAPQHLHTLAVTFSAPTTIILGTLPAGAAPRDIQFVNDVAISGGTPVASVGTAAAPTSWLAAGTLTAGANPPQAVVAGVGRPTADTTLQLVFTGGVLAGSGRCILTYTPVV